MAVQVPTETETVRTIHIQIGSEWTKADFGRDIPHAEAMEKARIILDTFDREKNDG